MKAVKANKQYTIAETEKAAYLAQGYDIIDDSGAVVEHSPQATVAYSEHEKVLMENAALRAALERSKKEFTALKSKNEKAKADGRKDFKTEKGEV